MTLISPSIDLMSGKMLGQSSKKMKNIAFLLVLPKEYVNKLLGGKLYQRGPILEIDLQCGNGIEDK